MARTDPSTPRHAASAPPERTSRLLARLPMCVLRTHGTHPRMAATSRREAAAPCDNGEALGAQRERRAGAPNATSLNATTTSAIIRQRPSEARVTEEERPG